MTVTTHSPYGEVPVTHPALAVQQRVQQQVVTQRVAQTFARLLESEDDGCSSSRSGTSTPPMVSEVCACGCGQSITVHQQKQQMHQQHQPQVGFVPALPIGQTWTNLQPQVHVPQQQPQPQPQQLYQTYSQQFNQTVVDQRTLALSRTISSSSSSTPLPLQLPTQQVARVPQVPQVSPVLQVSPVAQVSPIAQVSPVAQMPQMAQVQLPPAAQETQTSIRPVFRKIAKSGRKSPPKSDLRLVIRFKHGREGSYTTQSVMPMGTHVIIRGDWGQDVGVVVGIGYPDSREAPQRKRSWVSRIATSDELQQWRQLVAAEDSALQYIRKQCKQQTVPITVHRADYQLDGAKLTFHYSTEAARPDFKGLLKDAFREFRCRIWLNNCLPAKGERGDVLDLNAGPIPVVNTQGPSTSQQNAIGV